MELNRASVTREMWGGRVGGIVRAGRFWNGVYRTRIVAQRAAFLHISKSELGDIDLAEYIKRRLH